MICKDLHSHRVKTERVWRSLLRQTPLRAAIVAQGQQSTLRTRYSEECSAYLS